MNEMKKLTAEVLPHLQARKMLQKLGCKQVVIPEVRTTGKTGNMVPGACHENVAELVARCGGKHLTGYSIEKLGEKLGERMTLLILHSIWETPEGRFVEVTKTQNGEFRDVTDLFAVIHQSNKGEPTKLPYFAKMLFEESKVHFIEKYYAPESYDVPWSLLKSQVTKVLSPDTRDYSVQDKRYWDYHNELQNCWKRVA